MVRTQYITIEELNEILGSNYIESDKIKLYEASEIIEYNLFNSLAKWDDITEVPKEIKLATAYQFKYMEINDLFDEYNSGEFSLGKFSIRGGESKVNKNISEKARKYLIMSGYMNRLV